MRAIVSSKRDKRATYLMLAWKSPNVTLLPPLYLITLPERGKERRRLDRN